MIQNRTGTWAAFIGPQIAGVRAFGWQLDYRWTRWLPLSARRGTRGWRILPLGPLGNVTVGRVSKVAPTRQPRRSQ